MTDCADNTFYLIFDRPLTGDYLITVKANGHTYGIVSLAKDRKPSYFKLYFELNDGKQTDFLDGVKVEEAESAKFDVASYQGRAVLDVYRTAAQADGVYPAGLRLMYHRTLHIENGA